jgi:nucleoside-diphosphate-sugar epimerase
LNLLSNDVSFREKDDFRLRRKSKDDEVSRICLDVSKAERELNWKAGVSLEKGLRETIKWAKNEG